MKQSPLDKNDLDAKNNCQPPDVESCVFGVRFSESLGYGTREGNQFRFVFEYGDGPFHATYRWNPENDTWQWLMEQKDKNGKWASFADLTLTRVATR